MSVINGVAKKYDGTAIDYVSIFDWANGKCIAQVVPDTSGDWRYSYNKDLTVGIAYIADGCEPITHGAYELIHTGFRYWRVSKIVIRVYTLDIEGHAAELRFNTVSGIESNDPSRGISANQLNDKYIASNAFDNNPNTMAFNAYKSDGGGLQTWWIGYEFAEPQVVRSVSVQMRRDRSDTGLEWQTADIECSDDGINWVKYGVIEPRITKNNISLITTPVIVI